MRQLVRGGPLNHYFGGRGRSVYADLPGIRRAKHSPRWARHFRPRLLAWAGLSAFNRNRFYEIDRFYKARVDYPENAHWPDLKVIDPDDFSASLAQRLDALARAARPDYEGPINIGLPFNEDHRTASKDERAAWAKSRQALESKARHRTLEIDVDEANDSSRNRPYLIMQLAAHYGIFRDLFHPDAYFYPSVPLRVEYASKDEAGEDYVTPVLYGNDIKPGEAAAAPRVSVSAEPESLWTLVAVNADGNPFSPDRELLHWLVVNIPGGGAATDGDELLSYLPPLPFQGTGFHRFVFSLFRQDKGHLSSPDWGVRGDSLEDRSWSQSDWVKSTEDELTVGGLAFAQADWDLSVKAELYRRGLEEPIYDYAWPTVEVEAQAEWPQEPTPFHKLLDKHIPREESEAELLRMRMELQSPFAANAARPRFPNLLYDVDMERLARLPFLQRRRERLGTGRFRALYENRIQ